MDCGFVADGEFVVSGGHGTVAFEPVDPTFHGVAALSSRSPWLSIGSMADPPVKRGASSIRSTAANVISI
jgi:hypothetical protein